MRAARPIALLSSFVLLAPALAFAGDPPPWGLDRATLELAVLCVKGEVDAGALEALPNRFQGKGRTANYARVSRSRLSVLELEPFTEQAKRLEPDQRKAFARAKDLLLLEFGWPTSDTPALALAYSATAGVAEGCDGLVIDPMTLGLFTGARWKEERIRKAAPWPVKASAHFAIHAVPQESGTLLLDTGGLSRFGLEELILAPVPRMHSGAAGTMLNILVQRLVEGLGPDGEGRLVVRLTDLKNPEVRKTQLASVLPNARREVTIELSPSPGTGDLHPDGWVLRFPAPDCQGGEGECLEMAIAGLFGSRDEVTAIQHDDKMLAASARARAALLPYRGKVEKGLPPDETLLVKGPFKYAGGTEWMWVEVHEWKGDVLRGALNSAPVHVTGLRSGSRVEVRQQDVFDYIYRFEDGTFFGNETGKLMAPELFRDAGGGRSRIVNQH